MNVRLVPQSFPLTMSVPFNGAPDSLINIFLERFKAAAHLKVLNEEKAVEVKTIDLEISSEEGMEEMMNLINQPIQNEPDTSSS